MSDDEIVEERKKEIRREMGRVNNGVTGHDDDDGSLWVAYLTPC